MPPDPPVARLPADWAPWEDVLDYAIASRLRVTDSPDLDLDASELANENAKQWHVLLRQVSVLSCLVLSDCGQSRHNLISNLI